MRLVRLIYASTFDSRKTDISEIETIVKTAQKKNPLHHISGMLIFGNGYFLQCIEGSREAVNRLYLLICKDKRHQNVVLIDYSELSERDFDEWSMMSVILEPARAKKLRRFTIDETFDPYLLSALSARKMMLSLRQA